MDSSNVEHDVGMWASLHLRLQNFLPHQRCVTIPNGPLQWSQSCRARRAAGTVSFVTRTMVMRRSRVACVTLRADGGRDSTVIAVRATGAEVSQVTLSDDYSTMRRRTPDWGFCRSRKRILCLASNTRSILRLRTRANPGTTVAAIMQRYELL